MLFTPEAVQPPAEFKVVLADTGEQMIGTPFETPTNGVEIVTLGIDDVPAMLDLTAPTKPGPFKRGRMNSALSSGSAPTVNSSRWPASG